MMPALNTSTFSSYCSSLITSGAIKPGYPHFTVNRLDFPLMNFSAIEKLQIRG